MLDETANLPTSGTAVVQSASCKANEARYSASAVVALTANRPDALILNCELIDLTVCEWQEVDLGLYYLPYSLAVKAS